VGGCEAKDPETVHLSDETISQIVTRLQVASALVFALL
jgi:hypothetical protein